MLALLFRYVKGCCSNSRFVDLLMHTHKYLNIQIKHINDWNSLSPSTPRTSTKPKTERPMPRTQMAPATVNSSHPVYHEAVVFLFRAFLIFVVIAVATLILNQFTLKVINSPPLSHTHKCRVSPDLTNKPQSQPVKIIINHIDAQNSTKQSERGRHPIQSPTW